MFGFNLIDLLFAIASIAIGAVIGESLALGASTNIRLFAKTFGGACVYLILIYPFYRGLRRFPMVHPRCPCCETFPGHYTFGDSKWPRITFQCPSCKGEFIVWTNGKPSENETWEKPVLALKWPYAFGPYHRMKKPENGDVCDSGDNWR